LLNDATYSGVNTPTLVIANVARTYNGYKYRVLLKGNCLPGTESVAVTLAVPELSAVLTSKDVSCFGAGNGTVTATVSGGTAPYTFLWSDGAATASLTQLRA